MNKIVSSALIWFGAAVSIAEILTGSYFAPLGFARGMTAIVIGHVIGCALMFMAGFISAKAKKCSMEATSISFGFIGSKFFAILNVAQLAGWTAIMIYDCVLSVTSIVGLPRWIWCVIVGMLIILWLILGLKNISKLNTVAISALFVLTIVLCVVIFKDKAADIFTSSVSDKETLSFGAALELAIAMPLSWLPLIGDYTKDSDKPFGMSFASSLCYFFISIWMYAIGMCASIFTGESDIAQIMVKAGLGIVALFILVLSTVTTTFLDAYSAGVSAKAIFPKLNDKLAGIIITLIGTVCAIFLPMDNITNFLYLIGSVFAPMVAIMIADFFVLKVNFSEKKFKISRLIIWAVGFALYRVLMRFDIIIGNTTPSMLVTFAVTSITGIVEKKIALKKSGKTKN